MLAIRTAFASDPLAVTNSPDLQCGCLRGLTRGGAVGRAKLIVSGILVDDFAQLAVLGITYGSVTRADDAELGNLRACGKGATRGNEPLSGKRPLNLAELATREQPDIVSISSRDVSQTKDLPPGNRTHPTSSSTRTDDTGSTVGDTGSF